MVVATAEWPRAEPGAAPQLGDLLTDRCHYLRRDDRPIRVGHVGHSSERRRNRRGELGSVMYNQVGPPLLHDQKEVSDHGWCVDFAEELKERVGPTLLPWQCRGLGIAASVLLHPRAEVESGRDGPDSRLLDARTSLRCDGPAHLVTPHL
jgi:hypothetical protein